MKNENNMNVVLYLLAFLSLDTLLLCNKTSSGPGFHKTEIQALNTKILRLGSGECEEFEEEGFRCIEHYECIGDDVSLVTDGDSQTRLVNYIVYSTQNHKLHFRVVSIITKVSVEQSVPGYSHKYGFSIIDVTDTKCKTYSKVI